MSAGDRTGVERKLYAVAIIFSVALVIAGILVWRTRHAQKSTPLNAARRPDTPHKQSRSKAAGIHRTQASALSSSSRAETSVPTEDGPNVIIHPTSRIDAGDPAIGLTDKATGRSGILKLGQLTADGYRFVSVDPESNTAQFEKAGRTFVSPITPFEDASAAHSDTTKARAGGLIGAGTSLGSVAAASSPQTTIAAPLFRAVTLQTAAGPQITLTPVPNNPNIVALQTAGRTYVLPRDVTEAMINNNEMTIDQQASAILDSPSLKEVREGQDPASVGETAKQNPLQPPNLPSDLNIPPLPQNLPPGQ